MKRVALFLVIANLFLAGSAQAAAPLPLAEYWQRVQETRDLVARLEGSPPARGQDELLAAAGRWEQADAVLLPDGTTVLLDTSFLVARLRADPPDLAQLRGLLDVLLAARHTWPQAQHTAQDVAALQRILARLEFQWPAEQPSPLAQWWQRLMQRVQEFMARLLSGVGAGDASLLRYGLTVLGALVLAGIMVYVVRWLRAGLVAEAELDQKAADEAGLTATTALERAQASAGVGDYRAAVRYLYLSALLLLEERGLLRYDRSLTNREYLRSVAQSPELVAVLRPVVEVFERAWYGYQPLDAAAYDQYVAWVADLRRQR